MSNFPTKTPVTLLQELLMKKHMIPNFTLIYNGVGSHDPLFKYEVSADNISAVGSGKSKKEAKHDAASNLLNMLGYGDSREPIDLEVSVQSPYASTIKDNAVGQLTEFCCSKQLQMPEYKLTRDEGLPHAKIFCVSCMVSSFVTEAEARTKKQAKQQSAQLMLEKLTSYVSDLAVLEPTKEEDKDEIQTGSEDIIETLRKRGICKKSPLQDHLGIKISDYCYNFKDEFILNKSPTLQSLKDYTMEAFEDLERPEELVDKICEELEFEYSIKEAQAKSNVSCKIASLTINSAPTWTQMAIGTTISVAVKKVFIKTLKFFKTMSA